MNGGVAQETVVEALDEKAVDAYVDAAARQAGVEISFNVIGPGGFKIALDAIEGLRRQWAVELGPHGIRVVTLKTGGILESIPVTDPERAEIINNLLPSTLLKRAATLADVGNVAAWVASAQTRTLTAT